MRAFAGADLTFDSLVDSWQFSGFSTTIYLELTSMDGSTHHDQGPWSGTHLNVFFYYKKRRGHPGRNKLTRDMGARISPPIELAM